MKIGIICPYSISKGGGVKEIAFATQAELLKRGHDVYIITPQPRDFDETSKIPDRVLFVGNSTDFNSPFQTTIQVSASQNERIERLLKEHKFDILHFHEPWVPVLSRQILLRSTSVNVATFHAKLPETMMSRTITKVITPYTKPLLKYIHAYTAVSNAAAEYVRSLTDAPITIIPVGIDTEAFRPPARLNDNRKQKTIFYVGRLEPRKGLKYLMRAFALLQHKHPDVALVLAGNGPDRDKLEMMVNELDLKNVSFLGYVTDQEKHRYLTSTDLFCSPAIHGESFGIVLLEAMASGLVTVAGDNPGYESVMHGLGSLSLINPRHITEFARRMEMLLYESDLRKLWRQWAAAELPQYTYPTIVSQYEEVYQRAFADYGQ